MSFIDALSAMANSSASVRNEGDYIKDGLLYCGKCNTPKQTEVDLGGKIMKPYCMCQCETERYRNDEKARRIELNRQQIARNREIAFSDRDLQNCRFDADDGGNPQIIKIARNYVNNFRTFREDGKGLLLYGGTGTGKSFAAACIANAMLDKGVRVMMTNFPRIINTLSGMYDGKQAYIDDLNSYTLLIIDDLAIERQTEYTAEIVQNVIDSRYRSRKPLIVTTNIGYNEIMHPADIKKQRLYSRLKEMCLMIEVKGKDRREQIMENNMTELTRLLGL